MNWTLSNIDLIIELTLNHIRLSIVPILIGFVIAVPLGWLANRTPTLRSVIITGGSLLYTIPSLPLFVILPIVLGTRVLSELNLLVALSIYAVAIMVRSAADGIGAVPVEVRQAATALGYSTWQRFWRVEFPLSGPVLLAGMRVVSVSTIALVSVGIIIGSDNLGYLFQNGYQRRILEEIVVGIILSLLIAAVFDVLLVLLGKALLPWNAPASTRGRLRRRLADADPAAVQAGAGALR